MLTNTKATAVIATALACLMFCEAAGNVVAGGTAADATAGKPCKCMNWRNCHGEINSDVMCEQSYIFVCCVIPKSDINFHDDIQIIHI